jgi:hypothetical protein
MSDISVLSNQHKMLVETSDKVNNSVIVYKKCRLLSDASTKQKHPKLQISAGDIAAAKSVLVPFLTNLKQILKEDCLESDFIPSLVLEDYKRKLESNQYVKEDLDALIQALSEEKTVSEDDIATMDAIMAVLDSERGTLFRKLRTARG